MVVAARMHKRPEDAGGQLGRGGGSLDRNRAPQLRDRACRKDDRGEQREPGPAIEIDHELDQQAAEGGGAEREHERVDDALAGLIAAGGKSAALSA